MPSPTWWQVVRKCVQLWQLRGKPLRARCPFCCGEAGTGKELLAQCIHSYSAGHGSRSYPRTARRFPEPREHHLRNCQVPWTGVSNMPGLFEVADGGTLCLQQVQAIPADLRARLERPSATAPSRGWGADGPERGRALAATAALPAESRANLDDLVESFGGADVAVIEVPPLRERRDDIAPGSTSSATTPRSSDRRWGVAET